MRARVRDSQGDIKLFQFSLLADVIVKVKKDSEERWLGLGLAWATDGPVLRGDLRSGEHRRMK